MEPENEYDSFAVKVMTGQNEELAFGRYTGRLKNDNRVAKMNRAKVFTQYHGDFCMHLAQYLKKEEQRINYTDIAPFLAEKMAVSLNGILGGMREVPKYEISKSYSDVSGGFNYNFINFNYTATLDLILEALKKNPALLGTRRFNNSNYANEIGEYRHIHGTTSRDMILGVNDISQIEDSSFFEGENPIYLNNIIKLEANRMYEQFNDSRTNHILKQSNLIVIYGMSLGDTDKLWWNRICKLMMDDTGLHIIICCYNAPEENISRTDFLLYQGDIKERFTSFGDNIDDEKYREIKDRIHIQRNNIFEPLYKIVDFNPKENN